ncbi:MAG TPA: CoA-binding protein [Ktedonobacterales bacterium]
MAPVPDRYQDPRVIAEVINTAKTIAVVGLSPQRDRPSHEVAAYMQAQGYRIAPVNPNLDEALGEKCYPSLVDIPFPVDIVDVFRQPHAVPAIAEEAAMIGAKALWLQLGVISEEGAEIAERAGLWVVMDRCLMVDHRALNRSRS